MEAHVDTLGAMVAEIKENGRLRLTPLGGLNANNAEAENCRIHTRFHGTYEGTMQLTDASIHVNGKYNDTSRSFDVMEVLIDEKVSSKKMWKLLELWQEMWSALTPAPPLPEADI